MLKDIVDAATTTRRRANVCTERGTNRNGGDNDNDSGEYMEDGAILLLLSAMEGWMDGWMDGWLRAFRSS